MVVFSQVVIWGYAPDEKNHTHHHIHKGLYRAFKHLGYKVYWVHQQNMLDHETKQNIEIVPDTLFIVEHQRQKNLPIRDDCYYLLHNFYWDIEKKWLKFNGWKYKGFNDLAQKGRVVNLQVNRRDFYTEDKEFIDKERFYYCDTKNHRLFLPWATDLMPDEIEENKTIVSKLLNKRKNKIWIVGTLVDSWKELQKIGRRRKIPVEVNGGFSQRVSDEANIRMVRESWFSPAVQRFDQVNPGYIPCRIFKNISYGVMGVTNSPHVNALFNNKLIYDQNLNGLYDKMLKWDEQELETKQNIILELMDEVKLHHTYINRIGEIIKFFDRLQ